MKRLAFVLLFSGCSSLPVSVNKPVAAPALAVPNANKAAVIAQIPRIAINSQCGSYNNGKMPRGALKGFALSYARQVCGLKRKDPTSLLMARSRTLPESKGDTVDALSWYNSNFNSIGLKNDESGINTLRHVYMFGMGLSMRESNASYCEGRDQSASFTKSDTAEAGMFQTSWNASASTEGQGLKLLRFYQANPSKCWLDVYKEGASCGSYDAKNFGTGIGLEFQKLAKSCPAFAVEFALVTVRTIGGRAPYGHYGPIRRKQVELKTSCDSMLKQVQDLIEKNPEVCEGSDL